MDPIFKGYYDIDKDETTDSEFDYKNQLLNKCSLCNHLYSDFLNKKCT